MGFLESLDVPAAITNGLLIGILVELVQINSKLGRKGDDS